MGHLLVVLLLAVFSRHKKYYKVFYLTKLMRCKPLLVWPMRRRNLKKVQRRRSCLWMIFYKFFFYLWGLFIRIRNGRRLKNVYTRQLAVSQFWGLHDKVVGILIIFSYFTYHFVILMLPLKLVHLNKRAIFRRFCIYANASQSESNLEHGNLDSEEFVILILFQSISSALSCKYHWFYCFGIQRSGFPPLSSHSFACQPLFLWAHPPKRTMRARPSIY